MKKTLVMLALAISSIIYALPLVAGGFSAAVSPPRFELKANAGSVVSSVLKIYNRSAQAEEYEVETNDWLILADGTVKFEASLAKNSCRPWVKIERRIVRLRPGKPRKYRFEVHIPEGTPVRECRFALMLKGASTASADAGGSVNLPVSGRIGVIVYLSVGGAQPVLSLTRFYKDNYHESLVPMLDVTNSGQAHGRLSGMISGENSDGVRLNFNLVTLPIMPGTTRHIAMLPIHEDSAKPAPKVVFPLTLKGKVYWEKGSLSIDHILF